MLLSCPNCGTVTQVADVLIPSARLTATCSGCGAKIGGTVPSRLDSGRSIFRQKKKGGRAGGGVARGLSYDHQDAGAQKAPAEPDPKPGAPPSGAERGGGAAASRPSLGAVSRGLDPMRLAKLVASDMLLYNRDKMQRTAADGRLLSSMATEIVEAWEFYKRRVGVHTALGTSYFRDALNSVLTGDDPVI